MEYNSEINAMQIKALNNNSISKLLPKIIIKIFFIELTKNFTVFEIPLFKLYMFFRRLLSITKNIKKDIILNIKKMELEIFDRSLLAYHIEFINLMCASVFCSELKSDGL